MKSPFARSFQAVLVLLVILRSAGASRADEDPREVARGHYARGVDLAAEASYEAALKEFTDAYAASPHFAVLYNIGQAQMALRRSLSAIETLSRYLRDGRDQVPLSRREQVEAQVALLESRLAEISVTTDRPGALVTLDGREVGRTPLYQPIRVEAGAHTISASLAGGAAATQAVTLREAERQHLNLSVVAGAVDSPETVYPSPAPRSTSPPAAPVPPPITLPAPLERNPPPARRLALRRLAYVTAAVGAVAGGAALGVYLSKRGQYEDWRTANSALKMQTLATSSYQNAATANNARASSLTRANHAIAGLSIASGVLLAGGVTLFFVDRGRDGARSEVSGGTVVFSFAGMGGTPLSGGLAWSQPW